MDRPSVVPIDLDLLRSWPLPPQGGDKADRGTVLVVGGARQTFGAPLLAAEAALRVGAGKVQVATAEDTAENLGLALPEAFVEGLPVLPNGELAQTGAERILELAEGVDVVLLGPGLSEDEVERDQHDAVLRLADATGAVVLSGGEVSYAVSSGRGAWRGSGGAAGLATAGSGAVKAGVVAGLLARGASPEQAVVWGAGPTRARVPSSPPSLPGSSPET